MPLSLLWQSLLPVAQLTEASVKARAAELFSAGTGAPAVPPRLLAVIEKPTKWLCHLALTVSASVKRVHGNLDGYEAIGHLVADQLGIRLINDEPLLVGIPTT